MNKYLLLINISLIIWFKPALAIEIETVAPTENSITMALHISPTTKEAFFPIIYQFEQQTGIKVEIIKYTEDFEFEKYMTRWLTEGIDSPDVLYGQASMRFKTIVKAGYVHPITHLWKKNNWQKDFPKVLSEWISHQNEMYGLPYLRAPWGIYYQKSLLKDFGPVPQYWPEFISYCQKLIDAGIAPFSSTLKQPWLATAWFEYLVLRNYEMGFFYQIAKGEISYHDTRIQNIFNQWQALIKQGFFTSDYAKVRWEESLPFFYRKKFAFILMSQRLSSNLLSSSLIDDIEFMSFPKTKNKPVYESVPSLLFFISKHSKKKQLAEQFIEFVAQAKIQSQIAKTFHLIPANINSELGEDKYAQAGFTIIANAEQVSPFFDRATLPAFEKVAVKAFAQFLQDGDVEQLTNTLEEHRVEVFSKNTIK